MQQLTQEQIRRYFGSPNRFTRADGTITPKWEEQIIGTAVLPAPLPLSWNPRQKVTRFKAHKLIVPHINRALRLAYDDREVWNTIGDFGGCYAWRTMRTNTQKLSLHAWAIAIDLDVKDNPQGGTPRVHPKLIAYFASNGFLWGGTFGGSRVDGMHFEAGSDMIHLVRKSW